MIGKKGSPSSLAKRLHVVQDGRLVIRANDRDGNDHRAIPERLLDETETEALQDIALGGELARSRHALGEYEHDLLTTQELAEIVARADHLAHPREEDVDEGNGPRPAIHDGSRQPGRIRAQYQVRDHHRAIEWQEAPVVGGQDSRTLLRDHCVSAALHAEVVPVELFEEPQRAPGDARIQTERVVGMLLELREHSGGPLLVLRVQQNTRHQVPQAGGLVAILEGRNLWHRGSEIYTLRCRIESPPGRPFGRYAATAPLPQATEVRDGAVTQRKGIATKCLLSRTGSTHSRPSLGPTASSSSATSESPRASLERGACSKIVLERL